jgi:hypothetical protein
MSVYDRRCRNCFDGISFHPLMQISQVIIAPRQVPLRF